MRHPWLALFLGVYVAFGAWNWAAHRPVHQPDGVLAAQDPHQVDIARGTRLKMGRWILTVRADYVVTARILAFERYHFDSMADLIPEDLALGWGPMSDNRVLRALEITQSHRFYFWRAPPGSPLDRTGIITHSANTHVIPGDAGIARALAKLRPGQVVTLYGELVDGVRDDGLHFSTSMVRDDTGAGACEVLLVSRVQS